MKKLVILRGLPGAGKSELAELFAEQADGRIYSADDWLSTDGEYKWSRNDLKQAHDQCIASVEWDMSDKHNLIVVHNTSTTEDEVKTYTDLAAKHGYQVVSLIVENRHNGVSVHGVPASTITKMRNRFSVRL